MFGVKAYAIIGGVFLTIGVIGYFYYNHTQSRIEELVKNVAIYKEAAETTKKTLDKLEEDYKAEEEKSKKLENKMNKISSRSRELLKLLSEHDLEYLAYNRPETIKRLSNSKAKKITNELMEISKYE